MSITNDQLSSLAGSDADLVDVDGDKIGRVGQLYVDDTTGDPSWLTGLFGTSASFVPLQAAEITGATSAWRTPRTWSRTRRGSTTTGNCRQIRSSLFGGTDDAAHEETVARDISGPTTHDAMTRSEERLSVAMAMQARGRAPLRKYVVTENITQTLPVQREEVRVEREPITDANVADAEAGPAISEEEHEVVLHEERPVVEKEAVPVERVRLATDTVTEEATVSEDVRMEKITEVPDRTDR
jgi:uncharacterized protein (TIGR02271 family)